MLCTHCSSEKWRLGGNSALARSVLKYIYEGQQYEDALRYLT